ncbi:DUF4906 domain-containing protein, partial [Alistipes onderdonkii]
MKNILFAAAALAAMSLVACDEDTSDTMNLSPAAPTGGASVTLTLTDGDGTRTFFDDKAAAETWEKSLSSLAVYAFDKSGAC